MSKKILITGSAGFIYSNFIRSILYNYDEVQVIGVDNLSNGIDKKHNVYKHKNSKFYLADASDRNIMSKIFELETPEIVINGLGHDMACTQILLAVSAEYNIEHFLHSSSYSPEPTEKSEINNIDKMVLESKVKNCVLKLCEVYGPRQDVSNIIPSMILSGNMPYTQADCADFLYIDDACRKITDILNDRIEGKCDIKSGDVVGYNTVLDAINYITNGNYNKNQNNLLNRGLKRTCKWYDLNKWFYNI